MMGMVIGDINDDDSEDDGDGNDETIVTSWSFIVNKCGIFIGMFDSPRTLERIFLAPLYKWRK